MKKVSFTLLVLTCIVTLLFAHEQVHVLCDGVPLDLRELRRTEGFMQYERVPSTRRFTQTRNEARTTVFKEDFDSSTNLPDGWTVNNDPNISSVAVVADIGVDGTNAVQMRLWNDGSNSITSPPIAIPTGARLRFDYLAWVSWSNGWPDPYANLDRYGFLEIRVDGNTIYTINGSNHTSTMWDFQHHNEVALNQFSGQTIRIEFQWNYLATAMFFDISYLEFDNFEIYIPFDNDIQALAASGPTGPGVGIQVVYRINIRNIGVSTATGYTVRLMQVGNTTPLASVSGVALESFTFQTINVPWTPTTEGPMQIYGHIEWTADQNTANNSTPPINITVQPEGFMEVVLGDWLGSPTTRRDELQPVCYIYRNAVSVTLYLDHELEAGGYITALTYRFHGAGNISENPSDVKFYIGVTTKNDFNNFDYFTREEVEAMTLVFEGQLPVQAEGTRDITIPLETPFLYLEGNLVIVSWRLMDTDAYPNNTWDATRDVSITRSYTMYSDFIDIEHSWSWGVDIGGHPFFPNIRMLFDVSEIGHLTGVVSDATGPLADVKISIDGTDRNTITNKQGEYRFDFIFEGNVSITAVKHGYRDNNITNIPIVGGEITSRDIVMLPRPRVNVSGTIHASDTSAPLADVRVRLMG